MTNISTGSQVGPYTVKELIAHGGTGDVFRAHDARLDRDVALKALAPRFTADPDLLSRFAQEAQITAMLSHANIVAIHDVGSHLGLPYVVSELLEGMTLRERLKDGALPLDVAIRYALDITRGLTEAHRHGVVHCDLTPGNIFVTRDDRLKILDFGLAKLCDAAGSTRDTCVTATPALPRGAAGYASPEQVRGLAVDARTDIFSLGVILYEMSAGTAPFSGDSTVETLHAVLHHAPVPLHRRDARIPAAFEKVVQHCLEKNPEARFQSARDLSFMLSLFVQPAAAARRLSKAIAWTESTVDAAATRVRQIVSAGRPALGHAPERRAGA